MVTSSSNPYSFLSGFAQDRNLGRVIAQVDELKDAGSTSTTILSWTRENGRWFSFRLDWHATRICVVEKPIRQLRATGPAGLVSINTREGAIEEVIDSSDNGPRRRGDIRDLRLIGEHVYVTGMSRQVYRREGQDDWARRDDGVVQAPGKLNVSGFNAIDGLSETDIYAVGFGGEIWRCQENQWHQVDSPTNLILHRVRVINTDIAYASGQEGVLLRGKGDIWEPIFHDSVSDDLWGMEWYRGNLYVACDSGIFVLTKDDDLKQVDIGLTGKETFRHLHQNDGVMWSFGPKHILWTEDGSLWHDITP